LTARYLQDNSMLQIINSQHSFLLEAAGCLLDVSLKADSIH